MQFLVYIERESNALAPGCCYVVAIRDAWRTGPRRYREQGGKISMNADKELVEGMARQLFDCLRNGHLCLVRGDTASARASVDEARAVHRRLLTICKVDTDSTVGTTLLSVLAEPVEGLAALIRQNRPA